MSAAYPPAAPGSPVAEAIAALRAGAAPQRQEPTLAFGVVELDQRLAGGGLSACALHEVAAGTSSFGDDAATSLFAAGIAARFCAGSGRNVLWALSKFDLYAPGLEQVGLGPDRIVYAQGRKDAEVLALAEDALRDGSLACVIAEVKAADQIATRRLQLAASDGRTPILLYRRHRARDLCPLAVNSSAVTRWRIACLASAPLPHAGIGRARWIVELVRQRNGNPFSLELEACDGTGRLALPVTAADRAAAPAGAINQAA